MSKMRLFLIFIFFVSSICLASNQEVYFGPKETTVTGVVTLLTFPGLPNYESIKKGDQAEKGAYLILKNPIDITLSPDEKKSDFNTPTKNVQILQLVVVNNSDWKEIKKGNYIQVIGELFSPTTGHHHARALIIVKDVKLLSKQKSADSQIKVTDEDKHLLKNQ